MIKKTSYLKTAAKAYHGAIDFEEISALGLTADDIVDFSVNSNPFGPASAVVEALQSATISRYPDKACLGLRQALGRQFNLSLDQIMVGNGTAELLWLIAFAFIEKTDNVVILEPTFGEYHRNARLMGGEICEWRALEDNNFELDEATIGQLLVQQRPAIFHLCSPNNPTGYQVSNQLLERWSVLSPETLFVVDEAYAQFLPQYESAMHAGLPNVLVLRSMTKDYSLAGVRLGYVTGPVDLIRVLEKLAIPWSVNEYAQIGGIAAIASQSEYEGMWRDLLDEGIRFKAGLRALGYGLVETPMHYFLMRVGDQLGDARLLRQRLLAEGLLVRLCESYDLPNYIRLSTQLPEQNQRLLDFLKVEKSLQT
ncbi:MAG: histidinol-phosphate aminotransferase [Chitinophagales bacterium]